jgi:hypothetical protein
MPRCRGCGKEIEWGTTPDGKRVPLDPSPPVYRVVARGEGGLKVERDREAMVSHFSTCPDANRFSASKKAADRTALYAAPETKKDQA